MEDEAIRELLKRLARAHPSGGSVIERVAITSQGSGSESVLRWMIDHGAQPEAALATTARQGVHETGRGDAPTATSAAPARYILPAGALD